MTTVPCVANIKRSGGGGREKREGKPLGARVLSLLIPVISGPGTLFYISDREFNSFVDNMIKLCVYKTKWTILITRSCALIR